MKNSKLVYCLIALACVCFAACENPIMKKWWAEPQPEGPKEPEVEYVPIVKNIPLVTHETVYDTIYQEVIKIVPEYIYETIYETEYVTVYEKVILEVPVYIYETVVEIKYETVYETVFETVYETIYEEVIKEVHADPTEEEIKEYIKEHINEIITIIKDEREHEFEIIVKEYIRDHFEEVIKIIKENPEYDEIIKEIIQSIPPEKIVEYLTKEQIEYILKQQPPQVILQTIQIIDIEYIIFAGDSRTYNGPHGPGATTDLTSQEKSSNDASVKAMAQALKEHSDYLIMLHGHANPTEFTNAETAVLMQLSMDRANSVEEKLKTTFTSSPINGNINDLIDRVSVSGYGGEKNLFGSNSTYAGLNRRVEMILVRVGI